MRVFSTEAFILCTEDYGESDKLVTFYGVAGGKLKGIAKGAKKSRKRFVHAFESCSLVELSWREGRTALVWIETCKLVEPHIELRTEVERWGYAALLLEIVMEMVPEGEPQPGLFELIREALAQLSNDKDSLNVTLLFMFRFLDLMGYLPALDTCGICGSPFNASTSWLWRPGKEMLVCPKHRSGQEDYLKMDLGTLVLIRRARSFPVGKIWRLRFGREMKSALFYSLLNWVRSQIQKNLKSLRMLEQVWSA
jgi:DNA repair protein RecO (recombination protein O)